MKISIINGSPKSGKNTSEILINFFLAELGGKHSVETYRPGKQPVSSEQLEQLRESDVILFAFPLYVDSIPSHLLKLLVEISNQTKLYSKTMVYCLVNNGFFEGIQNHIVIEQMQLWCASAGATWGQAIGLGAGEMLPFIADIPLGHGPNKNLGRAMKELVHNVQNKTGGDCMYISPNWPRPLWKLQSSLFVWYPRAKQNGLKIRELSATR
ncbi:MAG: NAD(P)H-dependent oxidoreductase [Clostridiales bacterium]|nr:NAD(P)H-dependent oxidoreductase [Clostridiales bacterium]